MLSYGATRPQQIYYESAMCGADELSHCIKDISTGIIIIKMLIRLLDYEAVPFSC